MTAVEFRTGDPVAVPKEKFDHLMIPDYHEGTAADTLQLQSGAILYAELKLAAAAVRKNWPAGETAEPQAPQAGPRRLQKLSLKRERGRS